MSHVNPQLPETAQQARRIALYIDPPSHHFLSDRLFHSETVRFGGDQLMEPYAHLRTVLEARGIPVHTADLMPPETGDGINVFVAIGSLSRYRVVARRTDTILSAFFAMECPIVEPSLYQALRRVRPYFKRLYSWSDSASLQRFTGEPLPFTPFKWPQSFNDVHEAIWQQTRRKFLVMINSNKLPRLSWQELYTERMRAVAFFSRTGEIDLYGNAWDQPSLRVGKTWLPYTLIRLHRALLREWQRWRPDPLLEAARHVYRGRAESKSETLGQYTFALCFENMVLKGWITEKIFDCFYAGTVPIYWGAPDIQEHIPENCFIDMRAFPNYSELRHYLRSLSEREIQAYRENARAFLRSPQFRAFSKDAFVELFRRMMTDDTGMTV